MTEIHFHMHLKFFSGLERALHLAQRRVHWDSNQIDEKKSEWDFYLAFKSASNHVNKERIFNFDLQKNKNSIFSSLLKSTKIATERFTKPH